ncbi:hypothetical protein GCM10020256_67420 [Streptomyces thermocoprophilus]
MSALPRNVPSSNELHGVRWLRSSYSTGANNCVETARPAMGAVRRAARRTRLEGPGRARAALLPRELGGVHGRGEPVLTRFSPVEEQDAAVVRRFTAVSVR